MKPRCVVWGMTLVVAGWLQATAMAQNTTNIFMPYDADADTVDLYHTDYDSIQGSDDLVVDYAAPYRWGGATNINLTTDRFAASAPGTDFGTSIYFAADNWNRVGFSPDPTHIGDFTDQITLEAWINPERVTGIQRVICRTDCHFLYLNGDEVEFWLAFSDASSLVLTTGDVNLTTGTWTHIAGQWNGSDMEIYVNGIRRANATTAGKPNILKPDGTSQWQVLGATPWADGWFQGYIDEVRISKVARFSAVNTSTYWLPFTSDASTVDLYHTDYDAIQGVDTDIVDYAAPYRWGYTVNVDTATERYSAEQANAALGTSVYFNGTDARIELSPDPSHIGEFTTSITVEAWIKPERVTGLQRILDRSGCHSLYLNGDEIEFWVNFDGGDPVAIISDGADLQVGQWVHVAGVWNGQSVEVYVNGTLAGWGFYAGKPNLLKPDGATQWQLIGCSAGQSEFFQGNIDEVRISKTARYLAPAAGASTAALDYTEGSGFEVDVESGGTYADQPVTITNAGLAPLVISQLEISGTDAAEFSVVGSPANLTVAAGGSEQISVRFAPSDTVRTLGKTAALTLTTNDPLQPTIEIALTGDAVPVELSALSVE